MKLCETCIYRNQDEYHKPCIVYRDDCEYYKKERDMTKGEKIAELINIRDNFNYTLAPREVFDDAIKALRQEPKTGHCKDCKHFEYDSVARVDGVPLIVAHEICNKWGDGCRTKEDGYCFLFEPQERSE